MRIHSILSCDEYILSRLKIHFQLKINIYFCNSKVWCLYFKSGNTTRQSKHLEIIYSRSCLFQWEKSYTKKRSYIGCVHPITAGNWRLLSLAKTTTITAVSREEIKIQRNKVTSYKAQAAGLEPIFLGPVLLESGDLGHQFSPLAIWTVPLKVMKYYP